MEFWDRLSTLNRIAVALERLADAAEAKMGKQRAPEQDESAIDYSTRLQSEELEEAHERYFRDTGRRLPLDQPVPSDPGVDWANLDPAQEVSLPALLVRRGHTREKS